MNLTTLATDTVAKKARREQEQRALDAEKQRLNMRARTIDLFFRLLGIVVADGDLYQYGGGHAVAIVDGHRLGLGAHAGQDKLGLFVVDDDAIVSLSLSVASMEELGRYLGAERIKTGVTGPFFKDAAPNGLSCYLPGQGVAVYWEGQPGADGRTVSGRHLDEPRLVACTTPLRPTDSYIAGRQYERDDIAAWLECLAAEWKPGPGLTKTQAQASSSAFLYAAEHLRQGSVRGDLGLD